MKTRLRTIAIVLTLALSMFLVPLEAHAYLDPGAGSYVLQLALAALVGTLFAIRLFWSRVKSFFGKLRSKQGNHDQSEGT